jgi:hypothetical protein
MAGKKIKIETVADYTDHTSKTTLWCIEHVEQGRQNKALSTKRSRKIKNRLLKGIIVTDNESGKSIIRKFDYPIEYIQQVFNTGNRTWNKWVILCAIEYTDDYNEFEDLDKITVMMDQKNTNKT